MVVFSSSSSSSSSSFSLFGKRRRFNLHHPCPRRRHQNHQTHHHHHHHPPKKYSSRGVLSFAAVKDDANARDEDFLHKLGVKLRKETGREAKMPPGRVGLFGVRETLEYLMDSNAFVETRVKKYGPIFKTAFFFKPTIAFGSKEAVDEFKSFEASLPADEALPETFRELPIQEPSR